MTIELRATLDKYTVQDGKEISITMSCVNNPQNLMALAGIGAGSAVQIQAVQESLPFDEDAAFLATIKTDPTL